MEGDTCIISLKTGAVNISIHALRVEGDIPKANKANGNGISIHALWVEGDDKREPAGNDRDKFLSTPSGWRAT